MLFDTGWKGRKLTNNMKVLGVNADRITLLVLSHGHRDHTGGLKALLKGRTKSEPLEIIAHPDALEPKSAKLFLFHIPLGLPPLNRKLQRKVEFRLAKEPVEILPGLSTTGEISLAERQEKPGVVSRALHRVDGKLVWDPVMDDLSLVLRAQDGLVLIMGCCHAGLLNTCAKATQLFKSRIKAVVGGTHMLEYSEEDVKHVADILESVYGTPQLFLNHCTGRWAIEQLKDRFGPEKVHDCYVGTELMFKI